jgi:hypothetical protein
MCAAELEMEKQAEIIAKEIEKSTAPVTFVSHRSRYGPYSPKDFFAFVEFVDSVVGVMNQQVTKKKEKITEFKFMKHADERTDGYMGPDADNLMIQKLFEQEKQRGQEATIFVMVLHLGA